MCDVQTVTVAHKACITGEPADLASLFRTYAAARACERTTRQDRHLRPPASRTAAGQRSFAYRAASLLNALPEEMRGLEMPAFKRAVRRFFIDEVT